MQVAHALTGSGLPRADAEVLLAHALRRDRVWLLAHPEAVLTDDEWTRYAQALERRRRFEPVAYIVGKQEFYGREFAIDARALIPRPATEGLVGLAMTFLRDGKEETRDVDSQIVAVSARTNVPWTPPSLVVDIGTGSGNVAVTLALERPDLRVIATDISADAIALARENADALGATVDFRVGDGAGPLADIAEPFVIVSNPPYIPAGTTLMNDVEGYEPHVALFGGPDGGDLKRAILAAAAANPCCLGTVMEYGRLLA